MSAREWIDPLESTESSDEPLLAMTQGLVDRGVIRGVDHEDGEIRRWLDWELASLIEGHFHETVDVGALSTADWTQWERRVSRHERSALRDPRRDRLRTAYWLLENGERVGTLAVESMRFGRPEIGISSLYVQPARRNRGIAKRAMDAVYDESIVAGMRGLRLDTHWCWQPAVRFYLRLGFWVWSWKHQLGLVRSSSLPAYRVEVEGPSARFSIADGGSWTMLIEARHGDTALGWTETATYSELETWSPLQYLAVSTFALHLAVRGWPLVRSAELWDHRHHWCDIGMPEGLAYKIAVFEAVDREAAYDVRTPRIPGLDYEGAMARRTNPRRAY